MGWVVDCGWRTWHESITAQGYGIFWMLRTSIMKVSHLYEQAPTPPRPLSTIIPRTKTPLAHSSLHLFYGNDQECMTHHPFPPSYKPKTHLPLPLSFPSSPPFTKQLKKNTTIQTHSQILHHNIPSHPNPNNPPLLQRQPTHTHPTPTHTQTPKTRPARPAPPTTTKKSSPPPAPPPPKKQGR